MKRAKFKGIAIVCFSYLPSVKKHKIRKYSSTAHLGKQNNTAWKG